MAIAYQIEKLDENLYALREDLTEGRFPIEIYLVIGREKAALIDTGLGTGDLKAAVSTVTGLPVLVLHTHGHIDHTGADSQFDEQYMSWDEPLFGAGEAEFAQADRQRLALIRTELAGRPAVLSAALSHRVRTARVTYRAVGDGDTIDLGGVELLTVATPGHTPGSLSYVNRRERYAFTGDGIADIHWFDQTSATDVWRFRNMLLHFAKKAAGVERIFAAHMPHAFDMSLIHNLQHCAEEILQGAHDKLENADYQFLKHGMLYAHRFGRATIFYDSEHVFPRPGKMET